MKHNLLLGAIIGDTIGSIYEFNPTKNYNFRLLDNRMEYTDDSIMTIAVAQWMQSGKDKKSLIYYMQKWGRKYRYPMGSYGGMFSTWLDSDNPMPYNSWGNGSAMRVSPVGFYSKTLEETLNAARICAEVSHNHPEGIKGAQATAAAVFLAKNGKNKNDIKEYIASAFGYDLNRTCDEIRPDYCFEPSCQETVPQSIIAFLDSNDFEDAIRLTISLGGDADTMGAITGAIAAAFYKEIPDEMYDFVWNKLPQDMQDVINNR